MVTLILSSRSLPAAGALAGAASNGGWRHHFWDPASLSKPSGPCIYYGGSDVADEVAAAYGLLLLEPPLDLLARVPSELTLREIGFGEYHHLPTFAEKRFMKPADVRRKCFDAGLYRDVRDARLEMPLSAITPILLSEPVEWLEEWRCFVLNGEVAAVSPYLRFGHVVWQPFSPGDDHAMPPGALDVAERLVKHTELDLPPAFVVDIGFIEGRGWAIVEFNPAWCSGLLGADPHKVLPVLERASVAKGTASAAERRWGPEAITRIAPLPEGGQRRPWVAPTS